MDEDVIYSFWESSSLDQFKIREFASQLNVYDADAKELRLQFPQRASSSRKLKKSKLAYLTQRRESKKAFTGVLSQNEVENVLASLYAKDGLEHRTYASAGATYSVETFIVIPKTEYTTKNSGVYYYDAEKNGMLKVLDAEIEHTKLVQTLNIEITGQCTAAIVLVGFVGRVTAKYRERGIRFLLLEAGAMLQQLSLGAAESKNAGGCIAGGYFDKELLRTLGFDDDSETVVAGVYVLGRVHS